MRRVLIVIGSRADEGLLDWPIRTLKADEEFQIITLGLHGRDFDQAFSEAQEVLHEEQPEVVLVLGDRFEILAAAVAAHLQRIPIAHIGGGDITLGSYDDAMRDCISRMATIHFTTSPAATARLASLGYSNVNEVGSPGIDYIRHADWKRARPFPNPYVVVSYQAETIDGVVDLPAVNRAIDGRNAVWISPNADRGNEAISGGKSYEHAEFLNLIYHCEEFIGNSSALLYEAPELGIKTRMIGKRQKGRSIPWGDGKASERIRDVLKYAAL